MDHAWAFERKCKEAADELYEKMVQEIAMGKGLPEIGDRIIQLAEDLTPIYSSDLHDLSDYLQDQWDEVKELGSWWDASFAACNNKALEFVADGFYGREDRLNALQDAYEAIRAAAEEEDPVSAVREAMELYASEAEELGMNDMPAKLTMRGPK